MTFKEFNDLLHTSYKGYVTFRKLYPGKFTKRGQDCMIWGPTKKVKEASGFDDISWASHLRNSPEEIQESRKLYDYLHNTSRIQSLNDILEAP